MYHFHVLCPLRDQVQVQVLPIDPVVAPGESVSTWIIVVPIILGIIAIVMLGVFLLSLVRECSFVYVVVTVHL